MPGFVMKRGIDLEREKSKRILFAFMLIYWLFAILVYLIAHPQFRYQGRVSDALSPSMIVGEIIDGMEIRQLVDVPAESLTEVSLLTDTFGRENNGILRITFMSDAGDMLASAEADLAVFRSNDYVRIPLFEPLQGHKGEVLTMIITTRGCSQGNALTIYAGNTVTTGRFDIVKEISEADRYSIDGQTGAGRLCVKLHGVDELIFYKVYWFLVGGVFVLVGSLCAHWWRQWGKGKNNPLVLICGMITRYGFLIQQLVGRDFKIKYKRSVLGMAWSFLNPLLTMMVQYIVFSTLFKSDIENFPVYLFSGIVFFNFFNEAVGSGMTSITGNGSLIKKVYVPKVVFPITKILSSLINFSLSLIPMFIVMLFTGAKFSPAIFLLLFDILCVVGFVTGMVLMLTTAMTFFQDTQFLWGVASMMWMYLTPVFYPESIIPAKMLTLYHMNPMYQYITFARICILDGASPAPMAYFWCLLSSVIVLFLGVAVFRKNQDKFIMYL